MREETAIEEFERQRHVLLDRDYPGITGLSPVALADMIEPLRPVVLRRAAAMVEPTRARVPFVLVVSPKLAPASETILRTELNGRAGFVSPDTADIDAFEPIAEVSLPSDDAYVLFDVDRGAETRGVTPDDAMGTLIAQERSPLTVAEGIALITLHPTVLERNNCFQLLASRRDDRRVPGLWISNKAPKLGFCWAGNHHSWLGAASCGGRAGVDAALTG